MIETALFDRLKAEVALVSNRIYAGVAPQGIDKPYITFHRLSAGYNYTHSGRSGAAAPRFQVSIFDIGYNSAKTIQAQVVTALEDWRTSDIQGVQIESIQDIHEQETKLYHVAIDFFIWHT